MKFGVSLFPLRPQQIIDVALKAEELGYDSVWVGEHVVTPVTTQSKFPYAGVKDDLHDAFHGQLPFYDPYAVLSHLAALTTTIKLAVSVSIVPLHDPFHLARSAMTLDLFTRGRFLMGMGGGWLKEEFEIIGRDWETRGTRFDETLDVMISLFNDETTEYNGKIFNVPPISMIPKPHTRPHPPFVFGGHAKPALRRAAYRGNGWLASELSPDEITVRIDEIKKMRSEAARNDIPFEFSCSITGNFDVAVIERYAAAGVDRLVVRPWVRGREALQSIELLAKQLGIST